MRGFWVLAAAALAACGGALTPQMRSAVLRSPHRRVVVFPFDYGGGSRNGAPAATAAFAARLRSDGFLVTDQGKTLNVYNASALHKTGAFNQLADAALLARALGAQTVVVGRVDNAYDRVDRTPPEYGRDGRGRRILLAPAVATRRAGLVLRVRLVDVRTGAVLWAGSYSGDLVGVALAAVADQVADVLNQQLLDALQNRPF